MLFEGMAEWLNAAVLKAAKGTNLRGFESLSLRQFTLRGLENTYIEKQQKVDGGLIHRPHFMVRNMVQTRTILALYSTLGANLVKKFNDFRWTNSLTSRGNTKRNDNLFAPKN